MLDDDLQSKAVKASLEGDWGMAITFNKKILSIDPENVEALNRNARAFLSLGQIKKARRTARKAIKLDPLNTIATKCLDKCELLEEFDKPPLPKRVNKNKFDYLEEPGKTQMAPLFKLGATEILMTIDPGDILSLTPHQHKVSVKTDSGKYVGCLPDDLANRIISHSSRGISFQVSVKSISSSNLTVFIKEQS